MKDFTFSRILGFLAALFAGLQGYSQLALDFAQTPEQMAQNLVGVGVEIFNVQVTAADGSYAYYTSTGTEIGTSQGILLTTGQAINAIGPNDETGLPQLSGTTCLNCDLYDNGFPGSPLLTIANGGLNTFDATTFEFDVVPQGDSISFDFIFASEEYLEWVGSSFNDVFGFFVSGPNVGVDVNIALIPGTSDPVAINSVNHITNTQYFFHNENPPGQGIQYDGFTTGLTASIGNLEPCEVYHIKLIIADGSDRLYDSAVFVGQLNSNPITITTSTVGGTEFMVEGCNDGTVQFTSTFVPNADLPVNFTLTGDAVFGVDYTTDPDLNLFYDAVNDFYTLFIPAGQTSVSFDILPIGDGLPEGQETITIQIVDQLCEGFLFQSSVDFNIIDEIEVSIDPASSTICNGQCVTLTGTALTDGSASFAWDPSTAVSDPLSLVVEVCPTTTTTYTLTSTLANCEVSASATVTVTEPTITFDVTNITCIDGSSGEIRPSIFNATPPYTYNWTFNGNPISTSEELIGVSEGTYCLTIVDSEGCTTTACTDVIEDQVLTIVDFEFSQYTCSAISCNGASDGSITIDVEGGTGAYTYSWTDAGNNPIAGDATANNLQAGTYTVTVTDDLGCEVTGVYTLVEPTPLDIEVVGTVDILCSGEETGVATVTSTGGCSPYFYNWSHNANLTTPVATGLGAGVYEVSVTDANGCTSAGTVTIVINEPGAPVSVTVDSVTSYPGGFNVSCPDAEDGGIEITVAGGIPGYFYQWTHVQTGDTYFTEDLTGVPCGTYNLVVTDSNDCIAQETVVLTCVPDWTVSADITPNPCGAPNAGLGEITLTIGGSHGGPYTVDWTGPSCPCTGDAITGLDSGTYTATITDVLGCTFVQNFSVGTNDAFVVTANITPADCGNACSGAIDLTITPSEVDLIVWSGPNGFTSNDADITGLCAGVYEVTITDADCEETFTYVVSEPEPIVVEFIDVVPPICFGQNNGSVTATATGGSGVYTFEWLPQAECFFAGANQADISNLFDCEYTVIVTDDTGCSVQATVNLEAPQVMDIFVSTTNFDGGYNVSCFGSNDGQISVTVSGGTPDCTTFAPECYNYDWSSCDPVNVPGSSFQGNLVAGTYCVLVTDANGCVATTQIPITQPDPIESSGSISDYNGFGISCPGECDGFITPNITGGSDNYIFYSWIEGEIGTNSPNATTLTDLCAGTYTLQVIDTNGCEEFITFELTEPTPIEITVDNITPVTCYQGNDGAIVVSATGGTGDYTFVWNGGVLFGNILANLTAGTYELVVTDTNGCSETVSVEVTEPEPFIVTASAFLTPGGVFNIDCAGESTGSINAVIEGGNPDYLIEWSGPGIVNPSILNQNNLSAGTYTIVVTDAEGCETQATVEITEPEEPLVVTAVVSLYPSGSEVSCFGACDGSIDLTVTGGTQPYTFLWELQDVSGNFAFTEDVQDLCAGMYEVLVADANGCEELLMFEITQPEQLQLNAVLSNFNGSNTSCAESCDGTLEIAPSGGLPDYTIEWLLNSEPITVSNDLLENLCAGDVVEITLTDVVDCSINQTFVISGPVPITLDAVVTQISCNGEADGAIDITVTGGTGVVTIVWDPVSGGDDLTNLEAGTYCVTATDENGCEVEACYEIIEPQVLTAVLSTTNANCGACDGTLQLTITGGTAPFSIEYTGPTAVADDATSADELCTGSYSAVVTDANGCEVVVSADVDGPLPILVSGTTEQPLCYSDCDGLIQATVTNAIEPATFIWTDESGAEVGTGAELANICDGLFTLNVVDANGCTQQAQFVIMQPDSITINGFSPLLPNGYGVSAFGASDGSIETDVTGGSPDYTLDWSGPTGIGVDTENPSGLAAGNYNLMVTDANGCVKDTIIVVIGPDDLTLPTGFTPNGDGLNDNFVILGVDLHPVNTFKVFNRWGSLVYEKNNYQNEWDGRNNDGEELPDATYFVLFEASGRQFATYVDLRR